MLAILKPGKPSKDPASYHLITLFSIRRKILEKLIYNRINKLTVTPKYQTEFRPKRNCCEQVLALTSYTGSVFHKALVDLTTAYDSIWLNGLMLKY